MVLWKYTAWSHLSVEHWGEDRSQFSYLLVQCVITVSSTGAQVYYPRYEILHFYFLGDTQGVLTEALNQGSGCLHNWRVSTHLHWFQSSSPSIIPKPALFSRIQYTGVHRQDWNTARSCYWSVTCGCIHWCCRWQSWVGWDQDNTACKT